MAVSDDDRPSGLVRLALTALGTLAAAVVLYVEGDAAVSTAPPALLATVVGVLVGAGLQFGSDETAVGRRVERAYREAPVSGMLLSFAAAGTVVLALSLTVGPALRANPAPLYQFLLGGMVGICLVQAAWVRRGRSV